MSRRRVVVTGLGIVSPVGIGVAAAWESILHARSGIGPITRFDAPTFPTRIAGEVKGFDVGAVSVGEGSAPLRHVHPLRPRRGDGGGGRRGTRDYTGDKERVGVCIGSGIGGLPLIEETRKPIIAGGRRKISPFFVPGIDHQHGLGPRVDPLRLRGPNIALGQRVLDGEPQHRRGRRG